MHVFVLFNLKTGVSVDEYEAWARSTDLPIVNDLESVNEFRVFRTKGLLNGDAAPYAYIETIDIGDMALFGENVATDTMKKVAAEFHQFADAPLFIASEPLA